MGMLDGKEALVTGAGQGVGRGIALALAGEGAQIAVAGRTEGKLLETCAEIARRGGRAVPIVCDVMIAADIERCVQQTVPHRGAGLGRVRCLQSHMPGRALYPRRDRARLCRRRADPRDDLRRGRQQPACQSARGSVGFGAGDSRGRQ